MRCCVAEDYVAMCTACKKAVDRKDLHYVNGLSYHTACSAQSGSNSGVSNSDETRLKVDIVTLKNLRSLLSPRSRAGTGKKKTVVKRKASSKRKTSVKKTAKRKTAPKRKAQTKKTVKKTKRSAQTRKTVKKTKRNSHQREKLRLERQSANLPHVKRLQVEKRQNASNQKWQRDHPNQQNAPYAEDQTLVHLALLQSSITFAIQTIGEYATDFCTFC